MHIKTGTWEANNTVCESDGLCDQAVLVSATKPEPQTRNRRLSPGSGNCGGGGGSFISGNEQPPRQRSPQNEPLSPGRTHTFRREKERRGPQHKGRGLRRESQKGAGRQRVSQKEKWAEDSLSLLKPPPAFPVQDSPAKLQPTVSYASKVKAGVASGAPEEDRPTIGDLLQNQWGLSFISEARPAAESPAPDAEPSRHTAQVPPEAAGPDCPPAGQEEGNGDLLLSCRHLVEALNYHSREWNVLCNRQKKDPKRVQWYKDHEKHPA